MLKGDSVKRGEAAGACEPLLLSALPLCRIGGAYVAYPPNYF